MDVQPAPPPEPSNRRILWAFLLCFTICAHRIYAGRYISGIVQLACAVGGSIWLYPLIRSVKALLNSIESGSLDNSDALDRISAWEQAHGGAGPLVLALIAFGIWIAWDAGRLVAGKFTDGQGRKITRWI